MVENVCEIIALGHCIINYNILHIFVSIFLHFVLSLSPILLCLGITPLGLEWGCQVQDVG